MKAGPIRTTGHVAKSCLSLPALVALAFVACHNCACNENRPLRVAFLPITASEGLFVASERGFFKQEGLSVELTRYESPNDAMNALLSSKVDVAHMIGYSTLITVWSKSPDSYHIVLSGVEDTATFTSRILVRNESDIQALQGLVGRTVGTYSGLTQRLNLTLALQGALGAESSSVEIVQLDPKMQIPALVSGRIDGLFTIDPYATVGIRRGVARSICDSPRARFIVDPFPTCATAVSSRLSTEVGRRLTSALWAATQWATANPGSAAALMAEARFAAIPEDLAQACGRYRWWQEGQEDVAAIQKLADLMLEHKLLDRAVDVRGMLAPTQEPVREPK
jgi:NitT/TauT family transport system substrate-binding protein